MSGPRVLQVVLSLNPGGTERLVVELATRLHAEIPMMVCCLDEAGVWARDLESQGIGVAALKRRAGFRPGIGRSIAALAKDHDATVIHAHHYSPFVYGALARISRPGVRVVFTEHGRLSDAPPSAKRRFANRLLAMFPDRVFAVSADLKVHMVEEGFGRDAVDVIYNGIDVGSRPDQTARARVRAALGVSDRTLVVGTIARLDPVKDLATLIRAVGMVSSPSTTETDLSLVIVGDGSERAALERLAAEIGISDRVHFLGHRDDAREWLAGCDLYANSSISEGVSLTILEAMAAGLSIVATSVGGTPEVVDASCGRLVPARSPTALASALFELAQAPALRQSLGRAARARVETRFTLERMIGEYRDVYLSAARGPQTAA